MEEAGKKVGAAAEQSRQQRGMFHQEVRVMLIGHADTAVKLDIAVGRELGCLVGEVLHPCRAQFWLETQPLV